MPEKDFIGVHVSVRGHCLPEHHNKRATEDTPRTLVRFIEAKMRENFCIVYSLEKWFDFMDAEAVLFIFKVDNLEGEYSDVLTRNERSPNGQVLKRLREIFRGPKHKPSRLWKKANFCFDELDITSDKDAEDLPSAEDIQHLGTIRVVAQRVTIHSTNKPKKILEKLPSRVSEIAESALKGKSLKNTIGFSKDERTFQPQNKFARYEPINGPGGQAFHFVFKYYPKRSLQNMGFLPLISPEPPSKKNKTRNAPGLGVFSSHSSTTTRNLPPGTHHRHSGQHTSEYKVPPASGPNRGGIRTPDSQARGLKRERGDEDSGEDYGQPTLFIRDCTNDDPEYFPTPTPDIIAPEAPNPRPGRKKQKRVAVPGKFLPREAASGCFEDRPGSKSKGQKIATAALKRAQRNRELERSKARKGKTVDRERRGGINPIDVEAVVMIDDDDAADSGTRVGDRKKGKEAVIETGTSSGSRHRDRRARVETADSSES